MENGTYRHGYKGVKRPDLAFVYFKTSVNKENGCRESLYKIGEFY